MLNKEKRQVKMSRNRYDTKNSLELNAEGAKRGEKIFLIRIKQSNKSQLLGQVLMIMLMVIVQ